jgi:acyl-CoA reductase-like NAD-dependent aldehyde dehydrogenase
MKRYGILVVSILAGLAVAWPLFAQEAEEGPRAGSRERRGGRSRMSSEEQQKAFATIEEQLGKMKAGIEGMPRDREGWRDLSDEERDKLREKFRKIRDERQQSLAVIAEQIDKLKGPRQLRQEHEEAIGKLDAVLKLAQKENAKETAASIEKLIAEKKKQLDAKLKTLGFDPDAGRQRRPR